jgi:GNAT superfamily N-acetyltransferase
MDNLEISEDQRRFTISAVDPRCKESIDLQWEMRRELDLLYNETTIDPPPIEQFLTPRAAFLVIWSKGEGVGCGAIKTMDERTAHIKRVFVTPKMRRKGLGRLIMKSLEAKAVELGYSIIFLETADKQFEALEMYRSLGYQRVPCAGRVPGTESSICFEKRL